VDGLNGFPEGIEAVLARTEVQLCIVHLVRASWRKPRSIREALANKWGTYPQVSQIWRRKWERITPF